MAYFAHVLAGTVVRVHVVADAVIADGGEAVGQEFLAGIYGYEQDSLVECFVTGDARFNYPGPGFVYDEARDAFIPPTPYPSWVLDEDTCLWVAPIAYPADGVHDWDEAAGDWVEVTNETV